MGNCESCGTENNDNASYCISCGKKFSSVEITKKMGTDQPYTGFSLNSESVKTVWIIAIIVAILEIVIAYILTSGVGNSSVSDHSPLGFVVGYILCVIYGFLVLKNAEPGNVSPWVASKKVAKILLVLGLISILTASGLTVSEVDNEALNQAMLEGENYDFPPLADLVGALGFIPIFSWLIGGFLIVYGITKYQLSKIVGK